MDFSRFLCSLILLPALVCGGTSQADTILSGRQRSLLVRSDGTLWGWGDNWQGQLGIGNTLYQYFPVQITSLNSVSAAAGWASHSLAAKSDGMAWGWGFNGYGQLGDGTVIQRYTPVQVKDATGQPFVGVVAVAAGEYHSLALKSDGTVWGWGDNEFGQVGDNTTVSRSTPVQVKDATGQPFDGVVAIAAGGYVSMALKSDGTVWAWGYGGYGQLGTGPPGYNSLFPVRCGSIDNVVAISGGAYHAVALLSGGAVWTWGRNSDGQLGTGTFTDSYVPVPTNVTTAIAIAAGERHTLATTSDGTVMAWGFNGQGQLGVDYPYLHNTPIAISSLNGIGVTAVGAGDHSFALATWRGVSLVWAWGYNYFGQLGDGTNGDRHTPVLTQTPVDADEDRLFDWQEYLWNTDPLNPDTNGDALSDGDDVHMGFDPLSLDVDGDGISNAQEYTLGTNAFWDDTDGDGVTDGQDAFPLDPTRSQGWPPDPNDHTPPVITITFPTSGITPL